MATESIEIQHQRRTHRSNTLGAMVPLVWFEAAIRARYMGWLGRIASVRAVPYASELVYLNNYFPYGPSQNYFSN